MPRRYRRAFIAPRYRTRVRDMASRASDFYRRTAPFLKKTAPIWMPAVRKAVKSAPKLDRAIKIVTDMKRKYRTRTRTTTRPTGPAMEYVRTPSEGNSTSYFTRKAMRIRGFKKRMMRVASMQMRKTELVGDVSWNVGRQSITTFIHNTNTELDTTTDIAVTNVTPSLMILNTKIHYMLSSGSSAGIKMRIYEGVYKRDMDAAFTPQVLWTNGMLDVGAETPQNIDSKPWSSVSFNQMCHITKVTNVFLPMGRTHEHYCNYGYNKLYSKELFNANDALYLAKWTRFTMFVCYGEPIADTDTDVSTASGRVLIVGTKTTRFKYNTPEIYRVNFTQAIPSTGIGTERQIDEATGAVETVVKL